MSSWLGRLGAKRPIVFVGAGFSKNARGGGKMPLWPDVSSALRDVFDGREPSSPHDALRVADWEPLVHRVHRWAAGDHREDRGMLRVHLLGALTRLHATGGRRLEAPHSDLVVPLLQLAIMHAGDAGVELARASAAGFFSVARSSSVPQPPSSIVALESFASDPRIRIGKTAAYGCTRLAMVSQGSLADAAEQASRQLELDPYREVANQALFARAQPLVFRSWLD